ncbi:MAG: YIP1 family protein [Calditrichaeota bacterium]|nr:MAG: YIP1 family protein [Calditrichota bacterium]
MLEKLIQEIKECVLTPTTTFARIKDDSRSITELTSELTIYLAAIPALAGFFGRVIIGHNVPFAGYYHVPLFSGLVWAGLLFLLSLLGVYGLAYLVAHLAINFAGQKDEVAAYKLVVYSFMPVFVLGIFSIIPALSGLYILGLYGIYLFYIGCPILMECPEEKALPYTVIVSTAGIITTVLLHRIAGMAIAASAPAF